MINLFAKSKRYFAILKGFIPGRLPVGVTEFDAWAQSILDTYPMPTSDLTSLKFTLASIIMHLGPQKAYVSKFYFYLTINAAAAKQVAGHTFYTLKKQQEDAAKAATATVVPNEAG